MGITVEFKDYEEMIAFARVLLAGTGLPTTAPVREVIKQEIKKPETKEAETVEEDTTVDEEPVEDDAAPTYTLEEVRAKLTALTRAGKQKEVRDILDYFKAKNVTALDPKDYAGVMEKAGAI